MIDSLGVIFPPGLLDHIPARTFEPPTYIEFCIELYGGRPKPKTYIPSYEEFVKSLQDMKVKELGENNVQTNEETFDISRYIIIYYIKK